MIMIERIAKAICADRAEPWGKMSPEERLSWLETARAVLQSIREPTEAMLDEGPPFPYMDASVWARMIDIEMINQS